MIDSSVLHFLACVSTTLEYSKDTNGFLCLTGVSRSMLRPSDKAKKALHSSYFCLTAFLVSKSSHLGCSCQVPNQIHNYHFFFFFRGEKGCPRFTQTFTSPMVHTLGSPRLFCNFRHTLTSPRQSYLHLTQSPNHTLTSPRPSYLHLTQSPNHALTSPRTSYPQLTQRSNYIISPPIKIELNS